MAIAYSGNPVLPRLLLFEVRNAGIDHVLHTWPECNLPISMDVIRCELLTHQKPFADGQGSMPSHGARVQDNDRLPYRGSFGILPS